VRFAPAGDSIGLTIIETTNAPGLGPPLHRRAEVEIFEVVSGRYLFEIDGHRLVAKRGDLVRVPSGAARAFVNLTGTGARQKVIFQPGIDAAAYFYELAQALDATAVPGGGQPDPSAAAALRERLTAFGQRWGIVFVGAPIVANEQALGGDVL
jgi:hypothetical protein